MGDDLYEGLAGDEPPGALPTGFGVPKGAGYPGGPLRGPGTAVAPGRMMTAAMRGSTAAAQGTEGLRPMTSVKGAGYQSKQPPGTAAGPRSTLDAFGQRTSGPAPPLAERADNGPEEQAKEIERKVHALLESSADAAARGDLVIALERAKEAGRKERQLVKHREATGTSDAVSMDLTYCVCFNLANSYHLSKMYAEAINTYSVIVKNKQYANSGRLRVNMGNIYYEEKAYPMAIKMYRIALDQIPPTSKELRLKIQRNIGAALVRLGQYSDAITAFESIMDVAPEIQAGFNLVVCYYALGDVDLMKRGFQRLLQVALPDNEAADEAEHGGSASDEEDDAAAAAKADLSRDVLREELRVRQKAAVASIANAAKLIAPTIDPGNWVAGFDWVIEQLRVDHAQVASELQICKALQFLQAKEFDRAIEEFKAFERKDTYLRTRAATNLSFLYFLEGDMAQASKYANLAVRHDRYNAKALVNMGNCLMDRSEMERAKELYLEAIGVEADCVEAIFNLGLVNKQLGVYTEALQAFEKLHTLVPASPEVIYQIANLHEMMGNYKAAAKYFNYMITKVPSDPGALTRLGQIFAKDDDETQAFHYHFEAYRFFPVNLEVISWLGVWYVKSELYEKAIEFFERASEIQPAEVKWRLMVASCHRRMNSYGRALELYEEIHSLHPENMECLRYLVMLCKDLGRRFDGYEAKLLRLERQAAQAAAGALTRAGAMGGGYDDGGYPQQVYQHQQQQQHGGGGYVSDEPGGAIDDVGTGGASGDHAYGSSADRFAAPSMTGNVASPAGGGARAREEETFADADLSDLLAD